MINYKQLTVRKMRKMFKCYGLATCKAAGSIRRSIEMALMEEMVETEGDILDWSFRNEEYIVRLRDMSQKNGLLYLDYFASLNNV
jgi:hypothetical protein